jgi:hypothetical protein
MESMSINESIEVAASVAPEDLRCGNFVAVLSVIREVPSFFWCGDSGTSSREEPVRIQLMQDDGTPLKVKAVCLPFVLAKDAHGKHRTLDARSCRLARLSTDYAKKVWKAARKTRRDGCELAPGLNEPS